IFTARRRFILLASPHPCLLRCLSSRGPPAGRHTSSSSAATIASSGPRRNTSGLRRAHLCHWTSAKMRRPSFGEANLGALIGAIVGATGGLFAIGIPPAILLRDPARLFGTPILAVISFLICGCSGWLIGGQLGPRLGEISNSRRGETVGGVLGG